MVIQKKYVFSKPFATLDTRKKLGQVNFRKDFWYCYEGHREICPMESLKQRRRRRLRKRHLQSEFTLLQTLSRLFHLVQFVTSWSFTSGVEFLNAVAKFRKRKRKSLSLFTSSSKREIGYFHVVTCSDGREMF